MSNRPSRMNPFPGLRPFTQEEDYLFFGREEQTLELLQRLGSHRFVAVVGTSGSGKSSLVRCGLLSELLGGKMLQAGAAWEIAVTHPGGNPLALLTEALLDSDLYDREEENARENLLATLSRSHFGLVEAVKQSGLGPDTNFLLVVDQFEEIFRFHEAGQVQQEVANEFVSILLEAVSQTEQPIYVVLTMRSDFIGECGQFEGLAEMVNRGEFLIPRLSREQYKRAVEGPVKVAGGQIAPRLLQRLLNDLGQQADQLPCLQHALMRTWSVWAEKSDADALDLDDYQQVGRMSEALSLHADEIYESLQTDRQRELCRGIFQALTVQESEGRGIRRPQRLGHLCRILEVSADELIPIIDAYRASGVTFLMPSPEVELTDQTIIDISHESLMRVWTRLRRWVEEEAQAAGIYQRLSESAFLYEQGKAGLYRDPELGIALAWQDAQHPNIAWAERYHSNFEAAIAFLEASRRASVAEEEAREAARQRELEQSRQLAEAQRLRLEQQQKSTRKLRKLVAGVAGVAVIAGVACAVALVLHNKADKLATLAALEAQNARKSTVKAEQAQRSTEEALTQVAAEKNRAEDNLRKAEAAEAESREAEKRSREFRYATDLQLAARLLQDENANASQVTDRLADHNPDKNKQLTPEEDLRSFEWHYLKKLVDSRGKVFAGFDKAVIDSVMTPEGELVTLDDEIRLQRFDAATRMEKGSPIDLKKGRTIGTKALSRDGRRVALSIGGKVQIVDSVTGGETVRAIPALARGGLLFSPDGRMLVTVDSSLGWWDAASGKPIALQDFKLPLYGPVSISSDGLTLAVGGLGTHRNAFSVFKLNPETREIAVLMNKFGETNAGTKRALAISPDGQTVAVSYFFQGALQIYRTSDSRLLSFHNAAHSSSISAIAFKPNNTELATAAMDGSIKVWEDYTQLQTTKFTTLMGHAEQVDAIAFVAGGKQVLSVGHDKTVRVWNLDQSASSVHQAVAGANASRARFSPDGLLLAVSGEGDRLRLRDAATGQVILELPKRNDASIASDSVAFSPDSRLLAVGFGGKKDVSYVELWDILNRRRLAVLPGATAIPDFAVDEHSGTIPGLAFSPDGKHLVAAFGSLQLLGWGDRGNYPLLVYDVAARQVVRRLEGHRNYCVAVTFSRDGSRMASASYDGTARIWDSNSWTELRVLENTDKATDLGQRRVYDVAFSPDGKHLAMASAEGNAIVWDSDTGAHVKTLAGHANEVWGVAFSPDGRTLASVSLDGTLRLWNTATWRELVRLEPGNSFTPRSVDFSPDGRRLVAAAPIPLLWSVQAVESEPELLSKQLAPLLASRQNFQNYVQLVSENLQLHFALEKLSRLETDSLPVQAALAATRAHWHASRADWKKSTEELDRLKALGSQLPETWLRTPALLRLAVALLHENRPVEAAALLTGGEVRRARDGSGTREIAFGFRFIPGAYPLKVSEVFRGSPAWRGGLRAGDAILKFNDIELSATTASKYSEIAGGPAGTKIKLTIRRSSQDQPQTVEIVKASHIHNDTTNQLIEELAEAIDRKLVDSPAHPGLLELRAELAGQSSDFEKQIADYTAAIEAIAAQSSDASTADLQRLHARRGNAYVGLKRWQQAFADYAKGITAETTDKDLLTNQALAQAKVLVWSGEKDVEIVWIDDNVPAGANLQGDTPWEFVGYPEHPVFSGQKSTRRQSQGLSQHFFTAGSPELLVGENDKLFAYVYLDSKNPPETVQLQFNDGSWEHRAFWGADKGHAPGRNNASNLRLGDLPEVGKWIRLEIPANAVGLNAGAKINGWAFTQFGGTCYWDRAGIVTRTPQEGQSFETPWQELAATYRLAGDQAAIDALVEKHPKQAGPIGSLFTTGGNRDWQRAVEIYSKGIQSEPTDTELLARRARAYEELKDWNSAAADWARAANKNPEGAKLLADFAGRLVKAGQSRLAMSQRQQAREILEATLKTDPGDAPAIDALAALLLDMSDPVTEWTALKPAEQKTTGGASLALQDDGSLQVVQVERKPHVITLADPGNSLQAIRIETSSVAIAGQGASPFTEYRILSTDLPETGFRGRYVRIDLPGTNAQFPRRAGDNDKKILTLAEVQVFREAENIARSGRASQSSTGYDGVASRAIDGNVDGDYLGAKTSTHTAEGTDLDPWWELDVGSEQLFDRVVIWNRTLDKDGGYFGERLKHFRIQILNKERRVIFERVIDASPNPSLEITREVHLARGEADQADGAAQWQLSLDSRPAHRFRISRKSTDQEWSVLKPARLTPAPGTILTAQEDGTYLVGAEDNLLVLPTLADTVKALRVETASAAGSGGSAASVFKDYRIEAIGAPRSNTGTLSGRYVRIDLPGDNSEFPRYLQDGARKAVVLAEVEVFQGNTNIARGRNARQSSTSSDRTAELAVDGNTDGRDLANSRDSVAMTDELRTSGEPWWEVDLGSMQPIDRVVVWRAGWGGSEERMRHFRVRFLDTDRRVIFEQVVDQAPNPSRLVDCRSLFFARTPPADGDAPHRSLRLSENFGVNSGGRYRIYSTEVYSLENEEAHAEARKISQPAARLAAAYDLNGAMSSSADWFRRALDRATTLKVREPVLTALLSHAEPLNELLKRKPHDARLQLAQARSQIRAGQKLLTQEKPQAALTEYLAASDSFKNWIDQNPEPKWTVLKPAKLTSSAGATLTLQPDGSVFVSGKLQAKDTFTFDVSNLPTGTTAIRLEALRDNRLAGGGPGTHAGGNFVLSEFRLLRGNEGDFETARPVSLKAAFASFEERPLETSLSPGEAGWSIGGGGAGSSQTAVFRVRNAEVPGGNQGAARIILDFHHKPFDSVPALLGRFRLSATNEPVDEDSFRALELKGTELADLDVAIGKAYARQGQFDNSAVAFARALDGTSEEKDRKQLCNQFKEFGAVLTPLAKLRTNDLQVQLALAMSHAESGKKALTEKRLDEALPELDKAREVFSRLMTEHPKPQWTVLEPTVMKSEGGADLALQSDGSILARGANPGQDTYTLTFESLPGPIAAIRLEALTDSTLPSRGPGRASNGNFVLSRISILDANEQPLPWAAAYADSSLQNYSVTNAIDGNLNSGWALSAGTGQPNVDRFAVFKLQHPWEPNGESARQIKLEFGGNLTGYNLGRFRLSATSDAGVIEVVEFHEDLRASGLVNVDLALGNTHGNQDRTNEAAAAYNRALNLSTDQASWVKTIGDAAGHVGVLEELSVLQADNPRFADALARHHLQHGALSRARQAAVKARALYERQLEAEPANIQLAGVLADLLLELSSKEWTMLKPVAMKSGGGANLTLEQDGSIFVSGTNSETDTYTISAELGAGNEITAIRLESMPDARLPNGASARSALGSFVLTQIDFEIQTGGPDTIRPLTIKNASADFAASDAPLAHAFDSDQNSYWSVWPRQGEPHAAVFHVDRFSTAGQDKVLLTTRLAFGTAKYPQRNLGRFRLSVSDASLPPERDKKLDAAKKITSPWPRLGATYHLLGDSEQALNAFSRAFEQASGENARAAVAQQAAACEDVFTELLKRAPDDKSLLLGQSKYLATKYLAENRLEEAVANFSKALEIAPEDFELLNQRADAHTKLNQWQAANRDYARVIELETDESRRRVAERNRAAVLLRLGQFPDGADVFMQEMLLSPGDYYRLRDAGISQMLAGRSGAAKVAAAQLFERFADPKTPDQAAWLVRTYIAQPGLVTKQNREKLLAAAKTAGGAQTALMTAAIHYRLGDLKQAEPLLKLGGDQVFQSLAAMLLYDQGKTYEALTSLKNVEGWFKSERAKDPGSAIPSQQAVWQVWGWKQAVWREAARKLAGPRLAELDKLLEQQPGKTAELLVRAQLLSGAGLHEEALVDLHRLGALKADSLESQSLHGRVLVALNRSDEALLQLNQAIAAGSRDANVYAARAAIHLRQGTTKQARSDLEKSLELEALEPSATALADLLLAEAEKSVVWTILQPKEMKSEGGATLTRLPNDSILVGGTNPLGDSYVIRAAVPAATRLSAIRLEALTHESLPKNGPGRDEQRDRGNFAMIEFDVRSVSPGGMHRPVQLSQVAATFFIRQIGVNHWNVGGRSGQPHTAFYQAENRTDLEADSGLEFRMRFSANMEWPLQNLGCFRLSYSDNPQAFEHEQQRCAALRAANPWIRLAKAQLLNAETEQAKVNFARAFSLAVDDAERTSVLDQLPTSDSIFSEIVKLLDDNPQLHLTLGRRFAAKGQWEQADSAFRRAVMQAATVVASTISAGFWKVEGYPYGLETVQPPESGPDPFVSVAQTGNAEKPGKLNWQAVTPDSNGRFSFGTERACHYVLTRLWSPVEQDVAVQMGDDDNLLLIVNDQAQFESKPNGGSATPKEYEIAVTLRAGWNTVLVKLQNSSGGCSLHLAFSHDPKDLIAARLGNRLYEAIRMIDTGRKDEGLAALTGLLDSKAGHDASYARRALAYEQLQQWELAIADWAKADELNPNGRVGGLYLERRIAANGKMQQYDQQLAGWTTLLERNPRNHWAFSGRARVYDTLQQWSQARADLDHAVEYSSPKELADRLIQRGQYFAMRGMWREAADDFAAAAVHNVPTNAVNDWTFTRDLALVQLVAGNREKYQQAATELFRKLGGNLSADQAKWLVYVYTAAPGMITDANRERLTAATTKVDSWWNSRLKAALLFHSGEFQPAADLFDKNGGGPAFQYLAAMGHHRLDHAPRARQLFGQGNAWLQQQRDNDPECGSGVPRGKFAWQDWAVYLALQRETTRLFSSPRRSELDVPLKAEP